MSRTVFRIEIELGNDAMKTTGDIIRTLSDLKGRVGELADCGQERVIQDVNGNTVGRWGFYLDR